MKRAIFKKCAAALMAGAMLIGLSASAAMMPYLGTTPLGYNTQGMVGILDGTVGSGQGNSPFELAGAQAVLDLNQGGSGVYTYTANNNTTLNVPISANTFFDYSGTVNTGQTTSMPSAGDRNVPAGWEFVMAKYDGQEAGYILFYLGGAATTLPLSPANFWTTSPTQFAISGWTAFNPTPVPEPTTVIAGALLLLPFAASTVRFLRKHRKA
jgi:hypothetical protein